VSKFLANYFAGGPTLIGGGDRWGGDLFSPKFIVASVCKKQPRILSFVIF